MMREPARRLETRALRTRLRQGYSEVSPKFAAASVPANKADGPLVSGRGQQIGLVAQLAAQPGIALAPGLESPADRIEQPGLVRGLSRMAARLKKLAPSSAYHRMLCRRRI